jgi:SpoVK/Ycf46/Vps4 family AAA+-type ATPase
MSAILFGPPGTSKTELANEISKFLRWPKLTVDPSYFVKNGLDAIQAQAERLFEMLVYAEGIVVLFDEFDEMVRDRANAEEIFSRFLTTAMLPKLASINRSRRLVFIVATNYIDRFDLAISRPGRFDLILQIMPPTAQAKITNSPKLDEMLDSYGREAKAVALTELEKLTFDEFNTALPKFYECASATGFQKELESVAKRCTLQRVWNRNEGEKKTWAEVCKEQEGLISLRTGD